MRRIPKTIDLIVANAMHAFAQKVAMVRNIATLTSHRGGLAQLMKDSSIDINEEAARQLLCDISHDADIAQVMKALQAVGAPATLDLIGEGLRSVEERAKAAP